MLYLDSFICWQIFVCHIFLALQLFRKDLISAMKLADSEPLQEGSYVLISDPWRQEWEKGVQVPVNTAEVMKTDVK